MAGKKKALAIVDRSFQCDSPIGEGLLQLAEIICEAGDAVCVITQSRRDLRKEMDELGRGHDVEVRACKAYTTSASGIVFRICEALMFMLWTFFSLVRAQPANVYVATNPPVVVPFIVAVYCRLFRARYVYHLQDIHPEATHILVPLNGLAFKLLVTIDNYTLRHAHAVITLSDDMESHINTRRGIRSSIHLLDNPSFDSVTVPMAQRTKDVIFCGNAGRLQRIPLLTAAIRDYLKLGGKLKFTFAGGGVHLAALKALASEFTQVDCLGQIPAIEASELVSQHRWALLPIDDEVTNYAFPSKSSSYALSGAAILAICGEHTSVARWIENNRVGLVCAADHDALVKCFFSLEASEYSPLAISDEMRCRLQITNFAKRLRTIILD